MTNPSFPPEFLQLLHSVQAKRAKTVINHILQHGQITTAELKDRYGYNHPPRAIRDVREQGIPIVMFRITGADNRKIAAYKFGDPSTVRATQLSGRTAFTTKLKQQLIEKYGARCNIYLEPFPVNELQIDHRISYEIAGEAGVNPTDLNSYMLLSASANRAKSWSCESCKNWSNRSVETCQSCYWANPESYSHIAMRDIRRLDLLWVGEEVAEYTQLVAEAGKIQEVAPTYVKNILRRHFSTK
jgi:Helix-turn-helix domain